VQADPTKVELLSKEFAQKRDTLKSNLREGRRRGSRPRTRQAPLLTLPRALPLPPRSPCRPAGILAKYGGEEHLQAPPKEMLFAQTEQYVEYSRTGQVIKGLEPAIPKSKYEEDGMARRPHPRGRAARRTLTLPRHPQWRSFRRAVYPNNHTSVWGSYWEDGKWGYKCCGQFIKNSFCTGQAGFEARRKSQAHSAGRDM